MTKHRFAVLLLSLAAALPVLGEDEPIELKTDLDKVSYVIGHQIGSNLNRQGIEPDFDILIQAIKDAFTESEARFSQAEEQQIIRTFQQAQKVKAMGENAWKTQLTKPEMMTFDKDTDYFWIMETNKGTIKIKLLPDVAPMHVTSTIYLTKKGFYDGIKFHRVIPGFMAQGGDPLGNGSGGPGYKYDGEFDPKVKHDRPYRVSMANGGKDHPCTDGSQFFITFKATPGLDNIHTIFGDVVEGQDVVDKLEAAGNPDPRANGVPPKEKLVINKATIVEKAK